LPGLLLVLASGLWVFIEVADEVVEDETRALDRAILFALRSPSNLADPRGPPWLEEMGDAGRGRAGMAMLEKLVA
jgi:undecaprenyl-diphosphatase